ncbi:sensor histidine kinase [Cohnella hashimotonis]|uniref:Histidine kinase n=1 Tax=Cohnella hashimotonis TaxID=2826895 RepID=A0ABT6TL41_9BACL|nr:histidine kinase [Cohnella hashimotonis]MDI4647450.1 histidine kinase [Cohnella hashimotonis]
MRMVDKVAAIRVFPKLVLTFLVVLSPLYIIGLQINMSGLKNVNKEITHSLSSRVNLYMELLDNDFGGILLTLQDYINDEDLMKLSITAEIMSDVEKTQANLRLKNHLDILNRSSKFVEEASVFIPLIDRTITSNMEGIKDFDANQFKAMSGPLKTKESPFLFWKDRIFVTLVYPPSSRGKDPIFVAAVEISIPELVSTLDSYTNEGGGAVLVEKATNRIIAKTTLNAESEIIMDQPELMESTDSNATRKVDVDGQSYLITRKDSEHLGMSLLMYVPTKDVNQQLASHRVWLIILSLASIVIVIAFSYSIYRIIHKPLISLLQSFRRIEQGQFNHTVTYPLKDEFGYLYEEFNSMARKLNVLVHEVYEQQYRARLSELRHLQSQINPHFLYNTYFILYRMAQLEDNENLMRLTKHLGEYFQFITRDGTDEVPLEMEAHHARTYMEIQSIRFANRVEAHFGDLPIGAAAIQVPRLIMQPIIENAYKHSLELKSKNGWMNVEFSLRPDELIIAIEDNGHEFTAEKLERLKQVLRANDGFAESTGMINVHRRLKIKFGEAAGLRLSEGARGGLKVEIIIPIGERDQ